VDITIPNVPGFQFEPRKLRLEGGGVAPVIVRF